MIANQIFFGVIAAAAVAFVISWIWLVVRLMETIRATRQFLETTDRTITQVTGDVNESLRSLKAVTDDLGAFTGDIRLFTGSLRDAGRGVQQIAAGVKEIGDVVQDLGKETVASVCGLRAGLRTAFEVFLNNLLGSK